MIGKIGDGPETCRLLTRRSNRSGSCDRIHHSARSGADPDIAPDLLADVLPHALHAGRTLGHSEKPIPADVQERLKAAYGLDKPFWQQYTDFLSKAVRGDLGPSYTSALAVGH